MSALHFEIDASRLTGAADELQATPKQVKLSLSRAAGRTATTLRVLSARGLANKLQLRVIGLLRKRLKSLRIRKTGVDGFQLWYGINDMPASWFKGRPKETAIGAEARGQQFPGAFVARSKVKGRMTVFKRTGRSRLHIVEQNLAVEDKAIVFIEDEIFPMAEALFWRNFERDLRARVTYSIGEK
jgi:hypothetical protein